MRDKPALDQLIRLPQGSLHLGVLGQDPAPYVQRVVYLMLIRLPQGSLHLGLLG